ncbi:MAG TPA: uroporphyrinogen decarboxylase family protein [Candidatus Dormibacteraeota bacterium]|nr:uroporphyrinogen decarboxylase family protein [Candidatus Dormibacteraeota bacterium]
MAENQTPRQLVKNLLQGIAPQRPLFLPIVFARGARIENLAFRDFLSSPQKIFNSLRQIRGHLRSDGITCYFDPLLEAEELGAEAQWDASGAHRLLRWPLHDPSSEFAAEMPDEPKGSRVVVAVEVIRRLKAVTREDCLLTAGITGPITLAAQLMHLDLANPLRYADILSSTLDLTASAVSGIARAFVEAGANVIFLREDVTPILSDEDAEDWSSRLGTALNIVRFYEALPVLLLTSPLANPEALETIAAQSWDCVVCFSLDEVSAEQIATISRMGPGKAGIALPINWFESGATETASSELLRQAVSEILPAIVTTAGDMPASGDFERLKRMWEDMRQ